jgi:NDP-4-keto-2,6-dideoxyhexose 3-C-methyltransferase
MLRVSRGNRLYRQIQKCRICGASDLVEVLDLGTQALSGVFPRSPAEPLTSGPLRLVKCSGDGMSCGLVQLQHTYDLAELYGKNYGYRSGLNASMVRHLRGKVGRIIERIQLNRDSLVIDIGSNDATTLKAYPCGAGTLVGVDPTGTKFRDFYPAHVLLIPDFFSSEAIRREMGSRKASVVTSFSMFYDLEAPLDFMHEVAEVLEDEGLWVFEQSYLPSMLAQNSYDTVCHEHLEYYALGQVQWMTDKAGLKIVDVEFNDINGGSFSVVAAKRHSRHAVSDSVAAALRAEAGLALDALDTYRAFAERVARSRERLREFAEEASRSGRSVAALGASTKGNVILQYCGFTAADIVGIGEVNADKFGCYSPGSLIPIAPEQEVLDADPDYLLVLPWHFRRFFESNPRFIDRQLVFPLPALEVVKGCGR